jgi:hypothetical protein
MTVIQRFETALMASNIASAQVLQLALFFLLGCDFGWRTKIKCRLVWGACWRLAAAPSKARQGKANKDGGNEGGRGRDDLIPLLLFII